MRRFATHAPAFEPGAVEPGVRSFWERIDAFRAPDAPAPGQASFSMVLPPPNVTGVLHVGHALTVAIQDAVARHRRMRGEAVCWVPGLDHAGIATQTVVERNLMATRGLTRHDIGREAFLEEAHAWQRSSGGTIESQLELLGTSVDWSRRVYTLDDAHSAAVAEAFVRLHERGLIYRGERMINWCPHLSTALSDIEVDYVELAGTSRVTIPTRDGGTRAVECGAIDTFAYPLAAPDGSPAAAADGSAHGTIEVSTTRLETMLGDVGIAVHSGCVYFIYR